MEALTRWGPRACALVGFALYAWLAPPGPAWLDAGELGAAGFQLGSSHPTGFPLVMMLLKAASLVPVGEIAHRMHLASAVCAALAMLWVARLVASARGDAAGAVGGIAAALVMGLSLTFARQATVTEVYAPTAALLAGGLLLFDRVARGADARAGLALALVMGAGVGAHASHRLLLAVPVLLLLVVRLRRGARWPLVTPLVAVAAAAAVHMMLPVRSATGRTEAVDWGHPRTLGALVDHVTAREIRESFADEMMGGEVPVVRENAARVAGGAADDLGVLALVAALGGAVWLARERRARWLLMALLVVAVGDALYAVWVNPMGIADRQTGVPLAVAVAALAGFGLAWLGRIAGRAGVAVAAAAGAIALVGPAVVSLPELADGARSDAERRLYEAALEETAARGVLLTTSDSMSAGVLFARVVEGARPDVEWHVRQRGGAIARMEAREVMWEPGEDGMPMGMAAEARGVVVALGKRRRQEQVTGDRKQETGDGGNDLKNAGKEIDRMVAEGGDSNARVAWARSLTGLGRMAYGRKDVKGALALFDQALEVRPEHVEALVNRGVALAALGRIEEALRVTEAALAHEPNRVRALVNAARYRMALGDVEGARAYAERALAVKPDDRGAQEIRSRSRPAGSSGAGSDR